MKKMFALVMMMVITVTTNAMSFTTAKNEALFLSDKMAWELNLTDAQYDAVYEINLDYLMSVNGRNDAYGSWWKRRNTDLKYVLTAHQYEKFVTLNHFYRPLTWKNGNWTFNIYSHYSNKNHFYKGHPKGYASYKGGNNKKSDRYYADRKVNKPTPKHGNDKANKGNGSTWRNTTGNNREVAHNTTSNKSSHFGSRR
jgi:hypothetical protein